MTELVSRFSNIRTEKRPVEGGSTYQAILADIEGRTYELVGRVTSRRYIYEEFDGFSSSVGINPTLWEVRREIGRRPAVVLTADIGVAEQDIKETLGFVNDPTLGPAFRLRRESLVRDTGFYGIWDPITEQINPVLEG